MFGYKKKLIIESRQGSEEKASEPYIASNMYPKISVRQMLNLFQLNRAFRLEK